MCTDILQTIFHYGQYVDTGEIVCLYVYVAVAKRNVTQISSNAIIIFRLSTRKRFLINNNIQIGDCHPRVLDGKTVYSFKISN